MLTRVRYARQVFCRVNFFFDESINVMVVVWRFNSYVCVYTHNRQRFEPKQSVVRSISIKHFWFWFLSTAVRVDRRLWILTWTLFAWSWARFRVNPGRVFFFQTGWYNFGQKTRENDVPAIVRKRSYKKIDILCSEIIFKQKRLKAQSEFVRFYLCISYLMCA